MYLPLAFLAWAFMHEAGVHATVAGVALAMLTRIKEDPGEHEAPAERVPAHRSPHLRRVLHPGVRVLRRGYRSSGTEFDHGVREPGGHRRDPGTGRRQADRRTARGLVHRTVHTGLRWPRGCPGWTSPPSAFRRDRLHRLLLIAELAFDDGSETQEYAKIAIFAASVISAFFAIIALRIRARSYRQMYDVDERDDDQDGIPDIYQTERGLP